MPLVSIVLPTHNRAPFLLQAFASIRSQTFADWELIIVDDGSTDDSRAVVARLTADTPQPVRYVYQDNAGPAVARNTGVDHARGEHIAFFDSDDYWLPHHLRDCVEALQSHPDVDWAYGACRVVEHATGKVRTPSTFYADGKPRPFLRLRARAAGRLWIIEDPAVTRCMITHGLFCGLQCSVLRSRVFAGLRLPPSHVGEDQVFVVLALKAGFRFAYYDNVHVLYHVHGDHVSAATGNGSVDMHVRRIEALVRCWEELPGRVRLTLAESRSLKRRLSREYFWTMGYAALWCHGRRREALEMFRRGLAYWPWDPWCWKTYLLALLRGGA